MRTIVFALLLATQVVFGQLPQAKPILNPCQDQDIPWNSNIKQLNEYARKVDMIFHSMDENKDNDLVYVTYKAADYSRIYTFLYGQYIGNATVYSEPNDAKLRSKISEQVELYINDADDITGSNSFSYHCKGQDLNVRLQGTSGGLMIAVTNMTASRQAMGKGKKS